jgi:hypothetical protein
MHKASFNSIGLTLRNKMKYGMFSIYFIELSDEEESSTNAPSSSRQGRKIDSKATEGRFSIKEKLCNLGLADVSYSVL